MFEVGRVTGLEPANGGITTRCLNHLATPAKLFIYINIPSYDKLRLGYYQNFLKNLPSKTMNTFFLNGEEYCINKTINLFELINYFNYNSSLLVIEYNNFICSKKEWDKIFIQNNDKIEIVTIVGGG